MLSLAFHDFGCDAYAGAGPNWQFGPGQTGILSVRNNTTPALPACCTRNVTINPVTLTRSGHTDTTPLPSFWPWPTASGGVGAALQGGVRDATDNIAATRIGIGNPSCPARRASAEHSLCGNPTHNGTAAISSFPLRISTHVWHNRGAVDAPVSRPLQTVPVPSRRRRA